jgi:type II secretory pathway pseudopilin PulG
MNGSANQPSSGVSLIELIIVLLLLSIGGVAIAQLYQDFNAGTTRASSSEAALAALSLPLEQMRADIKLAFQARVSGGALILRYYKLGPNPSPAQPPSLETLEITYTHSPSLKTLTRAQRSDATWCVDDGTSTCLAEIPRLPVTPYSTDPKRVIVRFSYPTFGGSSSDTLAFVADMDNVAFDCRGTNDLLKIKERAM